MCKGKGKGKHKGMYKGEGKGKGKCKGKGKGSIRAQFSSAGMPMVQWAVGNTGVMNGRGGS